MHFKNITLLLALLIFCGGVLISQKSSNQKLEREIKAARASQQNSKRLASLESPREAPSSMREKSSEISSEAASAERVEEVLAQVLGYIESLGDPKIDRIHGIEAIREVLEMIRPLNASELADFAKQMHENLDEGMLGVLSGDPYWQFFSLGILEKGDALASLDKLNTVRWIEEKNRGANQTIFASLAQQDLSAAKQWLRDFKGSPLEKEVFSEIYLATLVLKGSSEIADAIRQYGSLGQRIDLPEASREAIRSLYEDKKNTGIKAELGRILVNSQLTKNNAKVAQEEARALGLSHQELLPIFHTSKSIPHPDLPGFMDWMVQSATEAGDLESIQRRVKNVTGSWARRDMEGAAAWLTELSPSLAKDDAIVGFSGAVRGVDPEVSALWALEIAAPERRQKILEETLSIWGHSEPEAAAAWREEHGL